MIRRDSGFKYHSDLEDEIECFEGSPYEYEMLEDSLDLEAEIEYLQGIQDEYEISTYDWGLEAEIEYIEGLQDEERDDENYFWNLYESMEMEIIEEETHEDIENK